MKVLVLGADGYLGWPTALHFSARNHQVMTVDDFSKRKIEFEEGVEPLQHIPPLARRVESWKNITGNNIETRFGSLTNHRFIYKVLSEFQPDTIIHFAEQPSAPYSMKGREGAVFTQTNNVIGTLNLLFGMKKYVPNAHLVKLGTLGEYGTPNIDIEEGFIEIEHNGRKDTLPFPKQPFSFYHLSKVHDSNNIMFACKVWGLKATDLNQGVVYGLHTKETRLDDSFRTSFHYDSVFGTVLNRFVVQAVAGHPLTIYGKGGQTRGCLNIVDTIQCIDLAVKQPAQQGECRVFNQFTEQFSITDFATIVEEAGKQIGLDVKRKNISNPRKEMEEHYYNPKHTKLLDLGLQPHLLTHDEVKEMLKYVKQREANIDPTVIAPQIKWQH